MRLLVVLLVLITLLSGCTESLTGKVIEQETIVREEARPMEVYFCPEDDCKGHLLDFLQATDYIHCAFYDLDLPEVIETLKEEQDEVDVKLVIDKENSDKVSGINFVENKGTEQLMHNKFCIVDGNRILTGSFNPTKKDNFYNYNNMLIVYSKYLADNYETEFQELWNKNFGSGERVKYAVILNDKKIENYFCPEDSCSKHVIDNLAKAKREIYFMTFVFTHDEIGQALVNKHKEGIKVKGIFEKFGKSKYSEYYTLEKNGIEVKWDDYSYFIHHKVFIIDNETVITGSFNPSEAGDTANDENLLIIHDENIAKKYLEEFEEVLEF